MRRLALLTILVLVLASPLAGDEDAAHYFVDRGRKVLATKDWDEAERLFQKALAELPGLPTALLGLAEASHGRGDRKTAAARLEACLDACDENPGEDSAGVRKTAEGLLQKIDRARLEFRRAAAGYVSALRSLAHRSRTSSPDLARRCLERILKVRPDDAQARALLADLGDAPAPRSSGDGLFNGKDLGEWLADPPVWTVKEGVILAHAPTHAYWCRTKRELKGDYALEFEARITASHGADPAISMIFGMRALYDRWNVTCYDTKFRLVHYPGDPDKQEKLDEARYFQIPGGLDRTKWFTFRIAVKGDAATFSANGHTLFERKMTAGEFDGFVGLVVQECTAEFRRVALVK